jgi:hypothetical protein
MAKYRPVSARYFETIEIPLRVMLASLAGD